MKFKKYLKEGNYKKLFNIIAIVNNKKDLNYIEDVVKKSLGKKVINDKEYKKLQQEIKLLRKSVK